MSERCNRYVFKYFCSPLELTDFILRLADLAESTYGRDVYFSRFNQVLDNARLLGWRIPRFGQDVPEPFQELSPEAIDHIFENQAKILVDICPVSLVKLENGTEFPLKMVGGTTPAGDLKWKCHLLLDRKGQPYIQHEQRLLVKTLGTKIDCSVETSAYNERQLREYFGGDRGIWPVPFLPESFSDHPIAQVFMAEGVTEVVKIDENPPVQVLAKSLVPWYRPLELDRTKELPMSGYQVPPENLYVKETPLEPTSEPILEPIIEPESEDVDVVQALRQEDAAAEEREKEIHTRERAKRKRIREDKTDEPREVEFSQEIMENLSKLPKTPDDEEEKSYTLEKDDEIEEALEKALNSLPKIINLQVNLTDTESSKLAALEEALSTSGIISKSEAEVLRKDKDPAQQKRAEQWLISAINRLTLLANASARIGAVVSLVEQNQDMPIIIVQPREKWASKLQSVLEQKGLKVRLATEKKLTSLLQKMRPGKILVTSKLDTQLFNNTDALIIIASWFAPSTWVEKAEPGQLIYTISIKQLGLADSNYLGEYPVEIYDGPGLSLFKTSEIPAPKKKSSKPKIKPFKITLSKGKALKANSLEQAIELAKKKEAEGIKCQVIDPTEQVVYISNVGEVPDEEKV